MRKSSKQRIFPKTAHIPNDTRRCPAANFPTAAQNIVTAIKQQNMAAITADQNSFSSPISFRRAVNHTNAKSAGAMISTNFCNLSSIAVYPVHSNGLSSAPWYGGKRTVSDNNPTPTPAAT